MKSHLLTGAAFFMLGAAVVWFAAVQPRIKADQLRDARDAEYTDHGRKGYAALVLMRIGFTREHGSYQLASLDGGTTWWSVKDRGAVLEPADPQLVAHLDGWTALTAHVKEHGPIGAAGLTAGDERLLAAAGIEVKRQPPSVDR